MTAPKFDEYNNIKYIITLRSGKEATQTAIPIVDTTMAAL